MFSLILKSVYVVFRKYFYREVIYFDNNYRKIITDLYIFKGLLNAENEEKSKRNL